MYGFNILCGFGSNIEVTDHKNVRNRNLQSDGCEVQFSVSSGVHKFATCIIWATLNGTDGGQHKQVSLYQVQVIRRLN